MTPKNKIKRDERMIRLPKIVEMYLKGVPIIDISKKLGMKRSDIYTDLQFARTQWRKEATESRETLIAEQLKRIDLIESEAWGEWEKSKQNEEIFTFEVIDGKDIKTSSKKSRRVKCGEPRFLEIALDCIDKRCRILKIGGYEETVRGMSGQQDTSQAAIVEVVVETRDQAERMMNYEQYQAMTTPSEN